MSADEGEIINPSDCAQKHEKIKSPCNICDELSKDQKGEMREHNAKAKEMSKKRRRGAEPSTTPLQPDPVMKSRDAVVQPCKKLRSKNLLPLMEKLVESFENEDETEKSVEEPGTEHEVNKIAHRRMLNIAFRIVSKS